MCYLSFLISSSDLVFGRSTIWKWTVGTQLEAVWLKFTKCSTQLCNLVCLPPSALPLSSVSSVTCELLRRHLHAPRGIQVLNFKVYSNCGRGGCWSRGRRDVTEYHGTDRKCAPPVFLGEMGNILSKRFVQSEMFMPQWTIHLFHGRILWV